MTYKIELSPEANLQMGDILNYLSYRIGEVGNPLVALKWLNELYKTTSRIAESPRSGSLCDVNGDIDDKSERKAHFRHYKYKLLYHIEDNDTVVVDLICHDKQDYEKLL